MKLQGVHIFIGAITCAVVAAVVASFFLIGSPKTERARALDAQRLNDLMSIANAIDTIWNTENKLPASLDELLMNRGVYVQAIQDPETGIPYTYVTQSNSSYQLCATFALETANEGAYPAKPVSDRIWDHEAGNACFTLQPITHPK